MLEKPECISPQIERQWARGPVRRQQPSLRQNLVEIFADRQRVPDLDAVMSSGRAPRSLTKAAKWEPKAIRRTMLFTVEGEKDDICAVGQTLAAHDLCTSLRPYRKRHHMQAGVGHYGVFSGRTWQNQIYPMVKNVILQSD